MFKKFISLFLILIPINSFALIEVDITRGNLKPLPIAVSPLFQDSKSKKNFKKELNIEDLGSEISKVIENNLKTSGLFNPLSKDAFLQKPDIAHLKPRFEDWALIKSQALITGKGIRKQKDSYEKDNRLYYGKIRNSFDEWTKIKGVQEKILNIQEAPIKQGGDGAFLVFLRKNKY